MGEQVKWAEKKLADAEKENSLLKSDVESLRELVASSALSEEYEKRWPVVFRGCYGLHALKTGPACRSISMPKAT
jgi:hypothetical protein